MEVDEQFQELISSQDYKLLQKKSQILETQLINLKKEKLQLKARILTFKEQKDQLDTANKKLSESQIYLSRNGLDMAKKLLDFQSSNSELKISVSEKQMHFATQYRESLLENDKLKINYQTLLKELSKTKQQLSLISQQRQKEKAKTKYDKSIQVQRGSNTKSSSIQTLETMIRQEQHENILKVSTKNFQQKINQLNKRIQLVRTQQIAKFQKLQQEHKNKQKELEDQLKSICYSYEGQIIKMKGQSQVQNLEFIKVEKNMNQLILKHSNIIQELNACKKHQKQLLAFKKQHQTEIKKNNQVAKTLKMTIENDKKSQDEKNKELEKSYYDKEVIYISKLEELRNNNQVNEIKQQKMQKDIDLLKKQLQKCKQQIQAYKNTSKMTNKSNQSLKQQTSKLNQQSVSNLKLIKELELKFKQSNEDKLKYESQLKKKQQENKNIKDQLVVARIEAQKTNQNTNMDLIRENEELKNSIRALQIEYDKIFDGMRDDYDKLQSKFDQQSKDLLKIYEIPSGQIKKQKGISWKKLIGYCQQYFVEMVSTLMTLNNQYQKDDYNQILQNQFKALFQEIQKIKQDFKMPVQENIQKIHGHFESLPNKKGNNKNKN